MEIPLQVKHIHKDKGKQKAISEDKDDLQIQDMVMIKEEMEDVTMAETEARLSSTSEHESLQDMSMNLGEEDITGFLHELPKEVVMLLPGSPTKHNSSRGLQHGKSHTGLPTLTCRANMSSLSHSDS